MRKTQQELEIVKKKYNVDRLWSWSKLNTYTTSSYEYFLSYILHKQPDNENSSYGTMGGLVHQCIEDYYNGKISYEGMYDNFENGWLTAIDIADLKFDRNDEAKNNSIKEKYKYDLEHFFRHHNKLEHKVALERFLTAKIGNSILQGYADAITKDDNGNFVIIDWKTSTKYSGKTLDEHSGQLTVYAIALIQLGVPIEKIKCCFNFLKYTTVQYEQANGTVKFRDVERCKIGESLQSNAKIWLKKFGYSAEDTDEYLKLMLDTNGVECLPQEVQDKYKFNDCYVYIPLTQDLVDKWTKEIIATIADIEAREKDYAETHNENIFFDTEESVKSQSYYFATLCSYSSKLHKPYQRYLEQLENKKNGLDVFSSVGSAIENNKTENENKRVVDDLSWLDDI